jgi:hypothetical protein
MGKVHLIESTAPNGGVRTYCNRVGVPGKKRGVYLTTHSTFGAGTKTIPLRALHVEPEATCKLCLKERQM